VNDRAAWLALAFRTALPTAEKARIAFGPGPRREDFPKETIAREASDLAALEDLGVRVLHAADQEFPAALRRDEGPYVLQVAGSARLLSEPGVPWLAGPKRLGDALDRGERAVVVLSKGLLRARTLLRALHEPLADGQVALVSAEPPRASWGPVRDRRRDEICRRVTR